MSTLLVPWLLYPLLLAVLSYGCGLLLGWASGVRLPGVLVVPCGFAVVALIAQLAVTTDATAELAAPAVVVAAIAGFVVGRPLKPLGADGWAVGSAFGSFAVYAAPIVLSGSATFAGYIKLDDDSTLTALVDRAMEFGRNVSGLEPSTYQRTVDLLLDEGYPLASLLPMGLGDALLREDALWLYQPTMAFMAAMLALGLYALAMKVVDTPWLRALAAFTGAQAALLYGYVLWGGIKEMGTAWALPVLAALVPSAIKAERLRELIPLAALSALLLGVLNAGALVWIAPVLLFCLAMVWRERGLRDALERTGAFSGFLAVLALPTLVSAPAFLTSNIVTFDPVANLGAPLAPEQIAGIWPVGDFRLDPPRSGATRILILIAIVAAAAAVVWVARRRQWAMPVYVCGAVASGVALWAFSTPWIEAKAFATAAPAIPFAAVLAGALLIRSGRVVEGSVLGVVVVGAVFWSNALQYHDAWLAPRAQLEELEEVGEEFAGDSPALMTEYQPYGARHFLRRLDPEAASELRARLVQLRNGGSLDKGATANLDEFADEAIRVYRTLVLRRSPVESRPPSDYELVWKGDWHEVWQRPDSPTTPVLEHLPLGEDGQAGAVPACGEVLRLAERAGPSGRLAAVERPAAVIADLSSVRRPTAGGTREISVSVPIGGGYGVWLGGSWADRLELRIDGQPVGSQRHRLDHDGQYTPFGEVELARGRHTVTFDYSGPDFRPGSGSAGIFGAGPLVLSLTTADSPVITVPTSRARELCGKRLDWVEALRS